MLSITSTYLSLTKKSFSEIIELFNNEEFLARKLSMYIISNLSDLNAINNEFGFGYDQETGKVKVSVVDGTLQMKTVNGASQMSLNDSENVLALTNANTAVSTGSTIDQLKNAFSKELTYSSVGEGDDVLDQITFKINGKEINVEYDDYGIFSAEYTVDFVGEINVDATYEGSRGPETVKMGKIISKDPNSVYFAYGSECVQLYETYGDIFVYIKKRLKAI